MRECDCELLLSHTMRGLRPTPSPEPRGKARRTRQEGWKGEKARFPRGSGDDVAALSAGAHGKEAESVFIRVHPWADHLLNKQLRLDVSPGITGKHQPL